MLQATELFVWNWSSRGKAAEGIKGSLSFPSSYLGLAEPVNVVDNGDGTHTVSYTPTQEGPYTVAVKYADEEIPRR